MEGRRLMSTETPIVDVQSKLGGADEAGKGDHASEQKAQVFEVHQNDCVEMMMLEQEGLQNKKNKRSRSHDSSRTSRRLRRQ